ncbi:MAG: hypothetical protein JXA25_14515 [Anaerolineales bacterium]|nr:hypothetical protein [Anaerolineales bacterium]
MATERPLWEILLDCKKSEKLRCSECFQLMEYLAETAARAQDEEKARDLFLKHISCCPDCRDYCANRLEEYVEVEGKRISSRQSSTG